MRRLLTAAALGALLTSSFASHAYAGSINGETTADRVDIAAGSAVVSSGGGGGGGGPRCTWTPASVGEIVDFGGQGPNPGRPLTPEERREQASIPGPSDTELFAFFVKCPGQPERLELIDTSITVADLADLAYQEATRLIPTPAHDMNPRPEDGSFVNLGLWLAVEEQNVAPITAEAGNVWITAYPELVDATFDFGNDDNETCNGLGEVYEYGSNAVEQGPCGYTYRQPGTYTITIVSTWIIPYTSSNGAGTIEPAIESETTHEYQVNEIQTVGSDR